MSTKEMVYSIIDRLSDEQLEGLVMLLKGYSSDVNEIPNAETQAVMNDVNNRENLVGPFSSVHELMEDLNADD